MGGRGGGSLGILGCRILRDISVGKTLAGFPETCSLGEGGKKNKTKNSQYSLLHPKGSEGEGGKMAYEWLHVLKRLRAGDVEKLVQKKEGETKTKPGIMAMLGTAY